MFEVTHEVAVKNMTFEMPRSLRFWNKKFSILRFNCEIDQEEDNETKFKILGGLYFSAKMIHRKTPLSIFTLPPPVS